MSVTVQQLRDVEAVIGRWHVDGQPVEHWWERRVRRLHPGQDLNGPIPGRPRQLTVRTLLIGWLLTADTVTGDDEMLVNRVHQKLVQLHPAVRRRLGITATANGRLRTVTLRQVEYLWSRMVATVDGSPHFGGKDLTDEQRTEHEHARQRLIDSLLDATMPRDLHHAGAYSVDSTYLPSWARPYWRHQPRRHRAGDRIVDPDTGEILNHHATTDDEGGDDLDPAQRAALTHDPDARHRWMARERNGRQRTKADVFGYQITIASRVREDDGPAIPQLVERIAVKPANHGEAEAAVELLVGLNDAGQPLTDVVADRGFTFRRPEVFHQPLRDRGANLVMDLHPLQRGARGTHQGALLVDGQPCSPGLPPELWDLEQAQPGDDRRTLERKQAWFEYRQAWALKTITSTAGNTTVRAACPASGSGARAICELRPASVRLDPTTHLQIHPPANAAALPVCQQGSISLPSEVDVWRRQKHPFGTYAWHASFKPRRNVVEGFFGNLKHPSSEHLHRGTTHAFGLAANTLLVGLLAATINLRLLRSFKRDHSHQPDAGALFDVGPYRQEPQFRHGRRTRPASSVRAEQQRGAAVRRNGAPPGRPPVGAHARAGP